MHSVEKCLRYIQETLQVKDAHQKNGNNENLQWCVESSEGEVILLRQ